LLIVPTQIVIPAKAGSDERPRIAGRIEKIAVFFDMGGETQRVLARQPRRLVGVAPLQRLDDRHVIDDRARRAIVLVDRHLADRAHVDKQILGHLGEERAAAHPDDRLVKGDIGVGIFLQPLTIGAVMERIHQPAQFGDLVIGRVARRAAPPCFRAPP
jgi:hypothetical protein